MLRIRAAEKQAFAAVERDRFLERVYEVLRIHWVDVIASREEAAVKAMLGGWLGPLLEADIRSETLVARAMNVLFAVRCDFDEDPLHVPRVKELVLDPSAAADNSAERRVELFEEWLFNRYDEASARG